MKYLSIRIASLAAAGVAAATIPSPAHAQSMGPQDGCYQLTQQPGVGEIDDAGKICFQGLTAEGVGLNLRVLSVTPGGEMAFCGESHDFSFADQGTDHVRLTVQLTNPKGVITMTAQGAADFSKGSLDIAQKYTFTYLPSFDASSYFAKCH